MRKKIILFAILLVLLLGLLLLRRGAETKEMVQPAPQVETEAQSAMPKHEIQLGRVEKTEAESGIRIISPDGKAFVFSDVDIDGWCVDAVNYVVTGGLMSGVVTKDGEQKFHPDYGMTKSQFAMILYRFAHGEPVEEPKNTYDDVPSYEWFFDCVNWAESEGYLLGDTSDHFGANDYLTCEEVLTVLYRLAGKPEARTSLEDYPYAAKVSKDSESAIRWAWGNGLIAEDECVWYPTQSVSRAQIALLLMRYAQNVGISTT